MLSSHTHTGTKGGKEHEYGIQTHSWLIYDNNANGWLTASYVHNTYTQRRNRSLYADYIMRLGRCWFVWEKCNLDGKTGNQNGFGCAQNHIVLHKRREKRLPSIQRLPFIFAFLKRQKKIVKYLKSKTILEKFCERRNNIAFHLCSTTDPADTTQWTVFIISMKKKSINIPFPLQSSYLMEWCFVRI